MNTISWIKSIAGSIDNPVPFVSIVATKKHHISKQAKKLTVLTTNESLMEQFEIISISSSYEVIIKAGELPTNKLFVYGEEADDFKTVNYEGLTT